jgi:hypothetical protein
MDRYQKGYRVSFHRFQTPCIPDTGKGSEVVSAGLFDRLQGISVDQCRWEFTRANEVRQKPVSPDGSRESAVAG